MPFLRLGEVRLPELPSLHPSPSVGHNTHVFGKSELRSFLIGRHFSELQKCGSRCMTGFIEPQFHLKVITVLLPGSIVVGGREGRL
jgi:hypothetical protein